MSVIFMDGFDRNLDYSGAGPSFVSELLGHWVVPYTAFDIKDSFDNVNGRYAYYGAVLHGSEWSPTILRTPFEGFDDSNRLIIGFNFKFFNLTDRSGFMIFNQHNLNYTTECNIQFKANLSQIKFNFGGGFSVDVPEPDDWHHLEFDIRPTLDSNIVYIRCYLDEDLVFSGNLNADSNASNRTNEFVSFENPSISIDDFYCIKNDGIGSCTRLGPTARVNALFAPIDGAGVTQSWTPFWGSTVSSVLRYFPPIIENYLYTNEVPKTQQVPISNLYNIEYPKACQIRTIHTGVSETLYHMIDGEVVNTILVTNEFEPINETTIFDQGIMTTSEINSIVAGIST